jgi:hypothetical protein
VFHTEFRHGRFWSELDHFGNDRFFGEGPFRDGIALTQNLYNRRLDGVLSKAHHYDGRALGQNLTSASRALRLREGGTPLVKHGLSPKLHPAMGKMF